SLDNETPKPASAPLLFHEEKDDYRKRMVEVATSEEEEGMNLQFACWDRRINGWGG
ncbi:hypothetical protein A2U01_0005447, partial [Trifolium medium]|nr:hypothetical protein [Trifolium medium]